MKSPPPTEKKTRVISVMPHGPAYDYYKGEVPEIHWALPGGATVGFWSREWMDVLGAEVLKRTDRYEWEVWQPDFRADKIYSHTLDTGVTHRLFPAGEKQYGRWPLGEKGVYSASLLSSLVEEGRGRALVLLYGTYGFRFPFYYEILGALRGLKIPVFMRSGGMFRAPLSDLWGLHRPLTYLKTLKEHFQLKAAIARADVVSEQSAAALCQLRKIYRGRVEKLTMGCDFSFWTAAPSAAEKAALRLKLGVSSGKTLFFASGNFVPRKQLDRLVEAFASLGDRKDFFLLIAGHGGERESRRLAALAEPLVKGGRVLIHGFAEGETLRALYRAADVYVSVATDEGGPASVMKALACGLPVLTTPVGETADALRAQGAGRFVPLRDYAAWARALRDILEKGLPTPMPLAAARDKYDWPEVVARYVDVFKDLEAEYFERTHDGE